ncbi:unnamed protein product [Anisakis simplex]|uniref:Uncharacterized protein n=1 Tax=Anisakis simplex TaxID=6269 RepID=A0A3P6NNN1_ANISI|nr:unnamed protein product [Anisakis simplex]
MSKEANGYTLRTANSVYVDQNFELKELFTSLINESYAGQLKTDDFSQSAAVANVCF